MAADTLGQRWASLYVRRAARFGVLWCTATVLEGAAIGGTALGAVAELRAHGNRRRVGHLVRLS